MIRKDKLDTASVEICITNTKVDPNVPIYVGNDLFVMVLDTKRKPKNNIPQLIKAVLLLFGAIMFGVTISILGNDDRIKAHFAVLEGYDTKKTYNADLFPSWLWSFGCLYPLGGLFGSLIGAMTVDKFGRKRPSCGFCICLIIGSVAKFVSRYSHFSLLMIGRFFDGLGAAGFMVSLVLLVLETIHKNVEHIFKPLVQTFINLGIVLIGTSTLYDFAGFNWNFVFLATSIFPITVLITLYFYPESPKYVYASTHDYKKTREVYEQLRGKHYDEDEMDELQKLVSRDTNTKQMSMIDLFKETKIRFAVITLIVLHVGQQFCGINAIIAFSPMLLKKAGFNKPDVGGLLIASVGLIGSIFFAPFVSKVRRKILWISSFVLMAVSFIGYLISVTRPDNSKVNVFFLCSFVFSFQMGAGSVVWFISMEMFTSNAVGAAQGIASTFNWLANTLVYFLVPILNDKIGEKSLIIFLFFQILIILYSIFILEETYDKTPAEVLEEYNNTFLFFFGD